MPKPLTVHLTPAQARFVSGLLTLLPYTKDDIGNRTLLEVRYALHDITADQLADFIRIGGLAHAKSLFPKA